MTTSQAEAAPKNQQLARTGTTEETAAIIQQLVLEGDLANMSPPQRVMYYNQFCQALNLNPLTQPFRLIKFEGKLVMYATKDCTEQLRKINQVSITDVRKEQVGDIYLVTAFAEDWQGRKDIATGAISLLKDEVKWDKDASKMLKTGNVIPVTGVDLANLYMKCETKAKRRVTLSICGLGILDETELEEVALAEPVSMDDYMIGKDEVAQWQQALDECKTPEDVDRLAEQNKESGIGQNQIIRKMFVARKDALRKPTNKEKADRAVKDLQTQVTKKP